MKQTKAIRACFVAIGILAALVFIWALFFVPYRQLFQADQIFVAVPEIGKQQLGGRVKDALAAGKTNRVVLVAGLGAMLALIAAVGLKLTRIMEESEQPDGAVTQETAPSAAP